MKVSDVNIDDEFITVKAGDSIIDVAKSIATGGVPDAVVVNEKEEVVGSLDDYDIVSKVLAEEKDPNSMVASEIMSTHPPIKLETKLEEVYESMKSLDVSMLPVTDPERKLLGVVTIMDVLEAMAYGDYQSRGLRGFFNKLLNRGD